MIKLVIFDLDGTLVDSAEDIMYAANEMLIAAKMRPVQLDEIRRFIGEGFGPFLDEVAWENSREPNEIFEEFLVHYDKRLLERTKFYPGAEAFLREMFAQEHRKIGIVSNKPEYQVKLILEGLGVAKDKIVEIYGGDTFEVKKPEPKPLLEMMKLAGVAPHQTVMIGDSQADIGAAKNAGTHFIGVSFGYNTREKLKYHGAEIFIDHFDELASVIDDIRHEV